MPTRFHVSAFCVKMVDVDLRFRASANESNLEVELYGYLVQGELLPGMLVNFRPELRRGKYYQIRTIRQIFHPADLQAIRSQLQVESREPSECEKLLTNTIYALIIFCEDRREFQELVDLDIQNEDVEIFHDTE
jgi:hypothetical protein